MCKSEIFAKILHEVSEETEVPESDIVSRCRNAEAVDARYILVYFLYRKGFYASTIAPFLNCRKRSVNHMMSDFDSRMKHSPMMRLCFDRLHVKLGGAIIV